jgi:peroxiredoxin Q/BCP
MLSIGDKAPDFAAMDQDNISRSLKDYVGKWLLLYFYPQDDTPGCTIEACGFRDSYESLSKKVEILGVSADSAESHRTFIQKYQLPFPLLVDTERVLIGLFGADKKSYPSRVTFLIDPEHIIRKIYHGFDATHHAKEIEQDLVHLGL